MADASGGFSFLNLLTGTGLPSVASIKQQAVDTTKEYLPVTAGSVVLLLVAANVASESVSSLLPRRVRDVAGLAILAGAAYFIYDWYTKPQPPQSS